MNSATIRRRYNICTEEAKSTFLPRLVLMPANLHISGDLYVPRWLAQCGDVATNLP